MSIVDAERWVMQTHKGTVTVFRGAPWRNEVIASFTESDGAAVMALVAAHNHMLSGAQINVSTRVDL